MTGIIIYCAFCYLFEIGAHLIFQKLSLSLILAPIMAPIEFGVVVATIAKIIGEVGKKL